MEIKYRIIETLKGFSIQELKITYKCKGHFWWRKVAVSENWERIIYEYKYIGGSMPLVPVYMPYYATLNEAQAAIEKVIKSPIIHYYKKWPR